MSKLKKPLRGLFASTEVPVETPIRKTPPPAPLRDDRKKTPVPGVTKRPPERLAPPPRIKPATPAMIMSDTESVSDSKENKIMTVHYNFGAMRPEREGWVESDYAHFLKRLDLVQTEAFFLKGHLLSEAKERFFETNKTGWAEYCDQQLDMNYTTANQYIRVATEFDVTSHQRMDFGFEHFKALLPLSVEERREFLNETQSLSVKSLRNKVQELISKKTSDATVAPEKAALKRSNRFVRSLQELKLEIKSNSDSFLTLTQTQRWQVSAACQSIASQLLTLSRALADERDVILENTGAASRAGAFATADGVDSMTTLEITPSVTPRQDL